ncbi:hydrogenase expression/formation protein HypE, partial [bacterium]|nr:hydrogenase expression/formation protein HypE [bacterium]
EILEDAAVLDINKRIAFTTDSYVVQPLFFPGGDIGKLAISGTINDLAVMGAEAKYISASFIIEEGLEISILEKIAISMAETANEAHVAIVTGDTKVVRHGEADKLFINTSGIGIITPITTLSSGSCKPGDVVLLSGTIAEHGIVIIIKREDFGIEGNFKSDCMPISLLSKTLLKASPGLRCMRDPTRGGVATTLFEISKASNVGIILDEKMIPIRQEVKAACEMLGLDPLYIPSEGRFIAIVPPNEAEQALKSMTTHPDGKLAAIIGEVKEKPVGLSLITNTGGIRPLYPLEGFQFPRIC